MALFNTLEALLAVATEGTKGTAATLANADGNQNVFDAVLEDTTEMIERRRQNTFNRLPYVPSGHTGQATFGIELQGSGTSGSPTPQAFSRLFQACGLAQSTNTFTPTLDTDTQTNATIGHYFKAGKRRRLSAAMGNFTIEGTLGRQVSIPRVNFTMTGRYELEDDVAIITPTYPTVIPPRGVHSITIDGNAICVGRYSFTLNANVVYVPCSGASGFKWSAITDFNPTLVLTPETGLVASEDWTSALRAGTQYDIVMQFGSSAGNTITLSSDDCVLVEPTTIESVDNIARDIVTLHMPAPTITFS